MKDLEQVLVLLEHARDSYRMTRPDHGDAALSQAINIIKEHSKLRDITNDLNLDVAVTHEKDQVILQFAQPMPRITFDKEQALMLSGMIYGHATSIEKEKEQREKLRDKK